MWQQLFLRWHGNVHTVDSSIGAFRLFFRGAKHHQRSMSSKDYGGVAYNYNLHKIIGTGNIIRDLCQAMTTGE